MRVAWLKKARLLPFSFTYITLASSNAAVADVAQPLPGITTPLADIYAIGECDGNDGGDVGANFRQHDNQQRELTFFEAYLSERWLAMKKCLVCGLQPHRLYVYGHPSAHKGDDFFAFDKVGQLYKRGDVTKAIKFSAF
jgi:hypothetical protein